LGVIYKVKKSEGKPAEQEEVPKSQPEPEIVDDESDPF